MVESVNWGILGTGYASRQFALGLRADPGSRLAGVASRSPASAARFAREFGCASAYDSYAELVAAPTIDIVFVGTPNHRHRQDCLLALDADKAVVCEKPFAINAREANEVIALARRKGLFCMEAMWTRFMPVMSAVHRLVSDGTIGDVMLVNGVIGHRVEFDPKHRLYDPALGGGALLDLGVYAISLAIFLLGLPASLVASDARIGATGVDEDCTMLLRMPNDCKAMLAATICASPVSEMTVTGSQGRIRVHGPLYRPAGITLEGTSGGHDAAATHAGRYLTRLKARLFGPSAHAPAMRFPLAGNGAGYQATEARACFRDGRIESDVMPLAQTLATMEIMDSARRLWGLEYPSER